MISRVNLTVAVVKGGMSNERVISLRTAAQCVPALRSLGYNVVEIDVDKDLVSNLVCLQPDVIFNALHGRWGEDGIVQGCFELLRIPYTHSGVLASALAMNKQKAREVFQHNGLPIADGLLLQSKKLLLGHPMQVPYVIKPNNEGSSLGVYFVMNESESLPSLELLPEVVLIEKFIPGRELTVTIMDNRPLALTEIISPVWYDFDAKYELGGSDHILPAQVPDRIRDTCYSFALTAHQALGCKGVTRVDFRWNDRKDLEGLVVLELNTQPGMTATSLVPEQAKTCGISFQNLCKWLVEDASCSR